MIIIEQQSLVCIIYERESEMLLILLLLRLALQKGESQMQCQMVSLSFEVASFYKWNGRKSHKVHYYSSHDDDDKSKSAGERASKRTNKRTNEYSRVRFHRANVNNNSKQTNR